MPDPALAAAYDSYTRHDWDTCRGLAAAAVVADDRAEAERQVLLAESTWWTGRLEECIEHRQAAYQLSESLGDTRAAGVAAVWLYEHHCLRARPSVGTAWLQRARRLLDDDPECVEHCVLLLREVEQAHGGGRYDEALAYGERARALARSLGSLDLEAEALQAIGRVLIEKGQTETGLAALDEAMLFAVEGRLGPYSTGKVYCSLISACEEVGDLHRASEWTEITAQWAEQYPFAIFPGICRVHRATLLGLRGDLADAEKEATRGCAELIDGHLPNVAAGWAEVGDIRRRLGDFPGAEEAFARAAELRGRPCWGTALLRLAQGEVDEARRIIDGCVADQSASRLARARVLPAAVQVSIAADDLLAAEEHVDELEQIADAFDIALLRASAQLDAVGAHLTAAGIDAAEQRSPRPGGLTEREVEVLALVAQGWSNKDIARELTLSAKTVSRHLSNIFTKIGVSTRSGATAYAFRHGLVGRGR